MAAAKQYLDVLGGAAEQPMAAAKQYLDVEGGASDQPISSISGPALHVHRRLVTIAAVVALLLVAAIVFVFGGTAQTLPRAIARPSSTASVHTYPIHLAFAPSAPLGPQTGRVKRNQLTTSPIGMNAGYGTNAVKSAVVYRPQTSRSSYISGLLDDHGNGRAQAEQQTASLPRNKSGDVLAAETQAWHLMASADRAGRKVSAGKRRQHVIASLSFAVGAAMIFGNIEMAAAGLPPLSQQADVVAAAAMEATVDWPAILDNARRKGLEAGRAGSLSAVAQVISLMWLRTSMNYQYRYGGNLSSTLRRLYSEGGIPRFYRGFRFAVVQAPLVWFGTIASNVGMLVLLDSIPASAGLPLPIKIAAAAITSALWRIFCMPLDTANVALNVEGRPGFAKLKRTVLATGPGPLYRGSAATVASTFIGGFPWWLTYKFLDGRLPSFSPDKMLFTLLRAAFVGFAASAASDVVSNSFKVVKTTQQIAWLGANDTDPHRVDGTADSPFSQKGMSIAEALRLVLDTDGIKGLFGRGLKTKLLSNAIQGTLFSVLWKFFQLTRESA